MIDVWEQKKKIKWYESRAHFKPDEIKDLNTQAYDLGAGHFMEATAEVFGMGEKRKTEAIETLDRTQYRELNDYAEKQFTPFELRRSFAKYEAHLMALEAYKMGIGHARESVGYAYRLGDARLARIDEQLKGLQEKDLGPLQKSGNIFEARLLRALRRAKNPSKKGAVLDEKEEGNTRPGSRNR